MKICETTKPKVFFSFAKQLETLYFMFRTVSYFAKLKKKKKLSTLATTTSSDLLHTSPLLPPNSSLVHQQWSLTSPSSSLTPPPFLTYPPSYLMKMLKNCTVFFLTTVITILIWIRIIIKIGIRIRIKSVQILHNRMLRGVNNKWLTLYSKFQPQ